MHRGNRHRAVGSYEDDDYTDEEDQLGTTPISPSVAAQYMRGGQQSTYGNQYETNDDDVEDDSAAQSKASETKPKRNLTEGQQERVFSSLEQVWDMMGQGQVDDDYVIDCLFHFNFDIAKVTNWLLDHPGLTTLPPLPSETASLTATLTKKVSKPQLTVKVGSQSSLSKSSPLSSQQKAKSTPTPPTPTKTTVFKTNSPSVSSKVPFAQTPTNSRGSGLTPTAATPTPSSTTTTTKLDSPKPSTTEATTPTPSASKKRDSKASADVVSRINESQSQPNFKHNINLVVVGHVDAGKSTLMGHLLHLSQCVTQKEMHRNETDSKKIGKSSFAFAWVLDQTQEERSRGVTIDIAQAHFQTTHRHVTLLDAPGHRDFIPNMITGAAQADVAILVINSTIGEFEAGFDKGGQTREHALLIRSLGVSHVIVAVNQMDKVQWSQERFHEIQSKFSAFLSQLQFKENVVSFVPCCGYSGDNLVRRPSDPAAAWYTGPVIVDAIDTLPIPVRDIASRFAMSISNVYKAIGGIEVTGLIHAGHCSVGDSVLLVPGDTVINIKSITTRDTDCESASAGDAIHLVLSADDVSIFDVGMMLCDPDRPLLSSTRLKAQITVFAVDNALIPGCRVMFHHLQCSVPARIKPFIDLIDRSTGQPGKAKPRRLEGGNIATVEIQLDSLVAFDLFSVNKDLGRFALRSGAHTVAAGKIIECISS